MSFSTFSGPLRSGTVREGATRNCGVAVLAQTKVVNFNDAATANAAFRIPAGSQITRISFNTTTTFTAATTVTVNVGGTAVTAALTVTTGGLYVATNVNSQAVGRLISVGASDAVVTYDLSAGASSAGQGTLIVEYIQRQPDGSINPVSV
jgi:hypothetical protein